MLTTAKTKKNVREYTTGEEIANSITHGIGAVLSKLALIFMIIKVTAGNAGDAWAPGVALAAVLIYGISMLFEYLMSTLYHAIAHPGAKKVFKILDHSGIYVFIAGSYTPFCLLVLQGQSGIILLTVVWVIAIAGVVAEAFWVFRPRWISAVLYLLMGWAIVWFGPEVVNALSYEALVYLVAGGICYSVACIFYVLKKIRYMHTVFHLWILAGSICHFICIFFFIL